MDRQGLFLEWIIADGMSTDGTASILRNHSLLDSSFQVFDNPHRSTPRGLNIALRRATGEFIVRMDVHTEYARDYVVRSVATLLKEGADNVGGPARTLATAYWERAIAAGFHSRFATGGASFRDENYCGPAETVPYGCWRKSFLLKIGMFDEELVRNQDDELNLRIRIAGGLVWQEPSIVSYYRPRRTLHALFVQYFDYGFWRIAVLRKRRRVSGLRQLAPGLAVLAGVFLFVFIGAAWALRISSLEALGVRTLGFLALVYLVLSVWFGIAAARRHGWDLLVILPVVFATYQLSYGFGFLAGLLHWKRQ